MKKVLYRTFVGTVAFLCATASMADDKRSEDLEKCKLFESYAEMVMKGRQAGFPMSNLVESANGNELFLATIEKAYNSPRYGSQKMQDESIQNFKNDMYLQCYQSLRSK